MFILLEVIWSKSTLIQLFFVYLFNFLTDQIFDFLLLFKSLGNSLLCLLMNALILTHLHLFKHLSQFLEARL